MAQTRGTFSPCPGLRKNGLAGYLTELLLRKQVQCLEKDAPQSPSPQLVRNRSWLSCRTADDVVGCLLITESQK